MDKLRKEATVPTKLLKYRPGRHQIGERAAYQRDIFVRVLECTDGVGVALIGGRAVFALFRGGRQKPALPMKDEDMLKLFNSLAAGSATFKADGNTLTTSYDTSWHELWTGTSQKRTFKVEGDTLTITSDPAKNAAGVDLTFTIVLKRVEWELTTLSRPSRSEAYWCSGPALRQRLGGWLLGRALHHAPYRVSSMRAFVWVFGRLIVAERSSG